MAPNPRRMDATMAVWSCWMRGVLFPWLERDEYHALGGQWGCLHDKGTSCQEASRDGEQSNYWICNSRNRCTNRGASHPVVLVFPFNTTLLVFSRMRLLTSAVIDVYCICKKRQMKSRRVNEAHISQAPDVIGWNYPFQPSDVLFSIQSISRDSQTQLIQLAHTHT